MSDDDLAETLGRVESPMLEFKREVKDRDGKPYPVDTADGALLQLVQIRDEGRILERPSMTVDRALFDGANVVRVHVNASGAPPVRLDGVAWVRPGPLTKRASADDERVLSERRTAAALPFDARPLPGTSERDLDMELLRSTYIAAAVDPPHADVSVAGQCHAARRDGRGTDRAGCRGIPDAGAPRGHHERRCPPHV